MNVVQTRNIPAVRNDPERIQERQEWCADVDWAMSDPQVQAEYWDQFVAVFQKRVLAHGTDMAKVLDQAEQLTGLPRHRIAVVGVGWYEHLL